MLYSQWEQVGESEKLSGCGDLMPTIDMDF